MQTPRDRRYAASQSESLPVQRLWSQVRQELNGQPRQLKATDLPATAGSRSVPDQKAPSGGDFVQTREPRSGPEHAAVLPGAAARRA
jgi:hypothetical protein